MMNFKKNLILVALAAASAVCSKPMNVVFILTDDLG